MVSLQCKSDQCPMFVNRRLASRPWQTRLERDLHPFILGCGHLNEMHDKHVDIDLLNADNSKEARCLQSHCIPLTTWPSIAQHHSPASSQSRTDVLLPYSPNDPHPTY
jgi:hypothetical protein